MEGNLSISHNGNFFTVNKQKFCALSLRCDKILKENKSSELVIQEKLKTSNFALLISYIKNGEGILQKANLVGMLQASLLWQCNDLIEILQKKIIAKENQKEILRAIVFDLTNGYTLTTIEQYVINNFFDFTTQPSFLTLNVDIIKRVSPWPFDSTIDSQQLFNFYTDVFNKQGKVASSLFQYVNLEQVNLSDIIKLISDIHFDRSVLIGQLVSLVSKYENELINSENELQKQTQIASNLEKEAIACGQICEEKENELLECEHNILIVQSAIESSLHISTYQMNDGINEIYEMQCKKNELLKEGAKVSDELKAAEEQYNEAMAKLKQKRKKSENKK